MLSYRLVLYCDICIVSFKYSFTYGTLNLTFFITLHTLEYSLFWPSNWLHNMHLLQIVYTCLLTHLSVIGSFIAFVQTKMEIFLGFLVHWLQPITELRSFYLQSKFTRNSFISGRRSRPILWRQRCAETPSHTSTATSTLLCYWNSEKLVKHSHSASFYLGHYNNNYYY